MDNNKSFLSTYKVLLLFIAVMVVAGVAYAVKPGPSGELYTASAEGLYSTVKVQVRIDGETITEVTVLEHNETEDIGTKAVDQIPGAIVAANTPDVDDVSGATYTSIAIKKAVADCMAQAGLEAPEIAGADDGAEENADTGETIALGSYTPGTYTGEADGMMGPVTVAITVDETSITDVVITGDSETPEIGKKYIDDDTYKNSIIEAQSYEIDNISGATVTTDAVIAAAKQALEEAGK